jgi:hypothetical protein
MSHDTEETSSKRKFRKYDTAIDTSCAFETNDLNFTTANFYISCSDQYREKID